MRDGRIRAKHESDHAEQQRQALAAALDRLGVLDRSIIASEAKLTPAILLADSVKQIRSRISQLRDDTVEANLPGAVTLLSSEVDGIAQEVAQLFEDREIRQALARAQQDIAREDARIQRDLEREEARIGEPRASTDANKPKIADVSPNGPDAERRRSLLMSAALASCLVVGLVIGYLAAGRRESSAMVGVPTTTAASTASLQPIRPPEVVGSASPVSSADAPPTAAQDAGSELDAGIDAGPEVTGIAGADAGDGPAPSAGPREDGGPPKKAPYDPYDDPPPPSGPDPSASATALPVTNGNAPSPPNQLAPFSAAGAASALGPLASSVSGCKKQGDPSGSGVVRVTFAPSGHVTSSVVLGTLVGTSTGSCVARIFQGARIPAFEAPSRSIDASFTVP